MQTAECNTAYNQIGLLHNRLMSSFCFIPNNVRDISVKRTMGKKGKKANDTEGSKKPSIANTNMQGRE
jgi:hypothetical protein